MMTVLNELPHFARFLLEWKTPEQVFDARWGVKGYQDPSVVREAVVTSVTVATFLEVLSNYLVWSVIPTDTKTGPRADFTSLDGLKAFAEYVRGQIKTQGLRPIRRSAVRLCTDLQGYDPVAMRQFSASQAQYALTQIASNQAFEGLVYQVTGTSRRTWVIDYGFLFAYNGIDFEDMTFRAPSVD